MQWMRKTKFPHDKRRWSKHSDGLRECFTKKMMECGNVRGMYPIKSECFCHCGELSFSQQKWAYEALHNEKKYSKVKKNKILTTQNCATTEISLHNGIAQNAIKLSDKTTNPNLQNTIKLTNNKGKKGTIFTPTIT